MNFAKRVWQAFWRRAKRTSDADYWYSKEVELAAQRGDPDAQTRLAIAYHEGLGVEQNPQRAFNWWLAAANQGHSGAQGMIATAYDVGVAVEQDKSEALYWALLSSVNGNGIGNVMVPAISKDLTPDAIRAVLQRIDREYPGALRAIM
ncbi:sel1 repeat family protein [Phyllobacteriaceae bacterium JZ32]